MIGEGEKVRVREIRGADAARKHLGSLGFIAGALVAVVHISDGNMIIGVGDSRIAINRETAVRIIVEPVDAR
ncbi:MAG: ferrous iron transport protein A [Kiritimatiellae bacterium]|nr:ferrous iron transport protein A [Kiritimatiellia bacterium]